MLRGWSIVLHGCAFGFDFSGLRHENVDEADTDEG